MPEKNKDKHEAHNHYLDNVNDNVKSFYNELTDMFPNIRVTSGKRKTSPSGKFSHHHTGNAIDIGREHADVYNFLMNDKRGLELLNKYGLGVIDETDPKTMEKTHATAPHFHIGPDKYYSQIAQDRFKNFDKIDIKLSYNSKSYTPPPVTVPTADVVGTPIQQLPQPTFVKQGLEIPGGVFLYEDDFAKEIEKEAIKTQKAQQSEARQELIKEQETKNTLLQSVNNLAPSYSTPVTGQQQATGNSGRFSTGYEPMNIELPNSLPQLPNLFSF